MTIKKKIARCRLVLKTINSTGQVDESDRKHLTDLLVMVDFCADKLSKQPPSSILYKDSKKVLASIYDSCIELEKKCN